MRVSISVGTRFPAYATSMGRVLLAGAGAGPARRATRPRRAARAHAETIHDAAPLRTELDRVRRQGWALVDQELEAGLRSVAAPIRGREGAVVAAINVSAHATRTGLDDVKRDLLPPLLATAQAVERDLAAATPPAKATSR